MTRSPPAPRVPATLGRATDDEGVCPTCGTRRKTVFSCPECPPVTLCDCPSSAQPAFEISWLVVAAFGIAALAIATLVWACVPGLHL